MPQRILVIDDDPSVQEVVRAYLEHEGYRVLSASNGRDGLELAHSEQPALVVLDLNLPDLSGGTVCRHVRARSQVPILMLTAAGTADDKVAGFGLGADDYLVKPFSPRELVARIGALLRRSGEGEVPFGGRLSFDAGALVIDTVKHTVEVYGTVRELTPSEYKLLLALARHPGRVYSRYELINGIQGHDFAGFERTVDAHVKNLRRKVEHRPGEPRIVETVRGVGYRLGVQRS